ASEADIEDTLNQTHTHKATIDGLLQSKTYFYTGFGKGDEIADYSENMRSDGSTVRNVSINFYGVGLKRASDADIEDTLNMTETHKDILSGLLQSKTFFFTG